MLSDGKIELVSTATNKSIKTITPAHQGNVTEMTSAGDLLFLMYAHVGIVIIDISKDIIV